MKDLLRLTLEADERRSYARAVKFISGCVLVDDLVLNCMVIDLSVNGARLLFDRPLPDFSQATIRLALKLRLPNPVDFPMQVAWRDGMLLGVTFLDDPGDVAVALEPLLPEGCLVLPAPEPEPSADGGPGAAG